MKPIKTETLFPKKEIEIVLPLMPPQFVAAGFYKMPGYNGHWSVLKNSFESMEKAEEYCQSKIRNGWLCFKIFELK